MHDKLKAGVECQPNHGASLDRRLADFISRNTSCCAALLVPGGARSLYELQKSSHTIEARNDHLTINYHDTVYSTQWQGCAVEVSWGGERPLSDPSLIAHPCTVGIRRGSPTERRDYPLFRHTVINASRQSRGGTRHKRQNSWRRNREPTRTHAIRRRPLFYNPHSRRSPYCVIPEGSRHWRMPLHCSSTPRSDCHVYSGYHSEGGMVASLSPLPQYTFAVNLPVKT